jgi:hypothetical protein
MDKRNNRKNKGDTPRIIPPKKGSSEDAETLTNSGAWGGNRTRTATRTEGF